MPYDEKKRAYNIEYTKKHLKRVPLEMQREDYEKLSQAAADCGESVNGFIKKAIQARMESETLPRGLDNK